MRDADLAYEHAGQRITREAFYAIACDPRRSVAVEACAGAGKTWMLVSRIVRALLEDAQGGEVRPHEILAITFTKKAAGEMRQRLHEWLDMFSRLEPEQLRTELFIRGIDLEPSSNGESLLQNLNQLVLQTGRTVQIRTFHSWFATLLRTAPMGVLQALGLPASYELLEDDTEAVARVWRRFQAVVVADPALRADYDAVVAVHGRFQAHKGLTAALYKRVEFTLADDHGVVDASVQPFGEQFPAFAGLDEPAQAIGQPVLRDALWAAARALGGASAVTFAAKGSELEQALTAGDFAGVRTALLTQKEEPRKFSDKLLGIEAVRAAQQHLAELLAAQAQHEAWLYQQRMARLTRVLVAQFAALKRERGWVDMNDVERAALRLLADPALSGWMQQRLDARIRHLLIDEFQDTNPLQWQALYSWLSSYAGAGGAAGSAAGGAPSVFIVGDPKQSIYRFRRAEPQVFRAAQQFVVDGLQGERLGCDHTRRNAPAVLAAVNTVMGEAQEAGEYAGFRPHTTESTAPGQLLTLPVVPRAEATSDDAATTWRDSLTTPRTLPEETLHMQECRQAARWIAQRLAGGLRPDEILVLSRKRAPLGLLQEALRALGIPSEQPEKTDLADAPEVQDIMALVDALVSPTNDLALARALKSPLFGLPDAALVELAQRQRQQREGGRTPPTWFELIQKEERFSAIPRGLGAKLIQYQGWLAELPPHDALDAIYHDADALARFAAAVPRALRSGVLLHLRALLAASLQIDGARYATPYALVRALRAGGVKAPPAMPDETGMGAVQLLTVHGAKGLEATLVLLLDTQAAAARTETMGVLVDWPGEAPAPRRFVFLASEARPPACAAALLAREQDERRREELNALYVAMTRAQTELALSSIEPHKKPASSWWQRLQGLCTPAPVPAAVALSQEEEASAFLMKILPSAPVEWSLFATDIEVNNEQQAEPPESTEAALGRAMHRLLEWAAPPTPGAPGTVAIAPAPTPAQQQAVQREFALNPAQAEQAAAMAQRILQGEGAWAWDSAQIDWAGNEVEITHGGQVLRIDRLVRRRDTGAWWVLDYKSTAQPQQQPALRAQLQTYCAAVQHANPGAPVRAAFLTAQGAIVPVDANPMEPTPDANR
ncbi:MAG: UvrD-helicase domain-containing protein [Burkholderiaceae bacterium]|uniref:UvrD-helicase domain-containing protein n=1 Tax=Hydrogenophaga sp. TaxID=1904254 RepID=UPI002775346C|nr:UvrD-helicase domain-containing protein [Hydrogenophaga sp.]MDP2065588.1 UvrD-helicase domain-containing protein [Burkholderiaceae bacterium]MDZ4144929.1 UvrD-helicase domain-containing protein [Burkholderiales bacterium]MDZ4400795.1 UvrD-helicase domain-containing protein [Hydrogenophaga sp.]